MKRLADYMDSDYRRALRILFTGVVKLTECIARTMMRCLRDLGLFALHHPIFVAFLIGAYAYMLVTLAEARIERDNQVMKVYTLELKNDSLELTRGQ